MVRHIQRVVQALGGDIFEVLDQVPRTSAEQQRSKAIAPGAARGARIWTLREAGSETVVAGCVAILMVFHTDDATLPAGFDRVRTAHLSDTGRRSIGHE